MKIKIFYAAAIVFMACLLQSCTKESCTEFYDGVTYTPIYMPMSSLRNVNVQAPKTIAKNGKIYIKANYIFLNETNKGFHVIDNTNPATPVNIAFVNVPGNLDFAAKGNYLLVDNYRDLLTFDISNPANIRLVNRKENALPFRRYNYGFADNETQGVIVGYNEKAEKKELPCRSGGRSEWLDGLFLSGLSNASPTTLPKSYGGANGQAGSLSRFAQNNNYLYIANRFDITPIDITDPTQPNIKPVVNGFVNLETLYSFNNVLLAGSPNGMFIISLANPDIPATISSITHWRGCDPVVAQNNTAYVTVRGGGPCGGDRNILDEIDITDVQRPVLLKTYQLQNPYGLGIFNNKLGVCDGDAGFKIFDASIVKNVTLLSTVGNIKAYDVIMNNSNAILIAKDGLYQYNISNPLAPQLISKINIAN